MRDVDTQTRDASLEEKEPPGTGRPLQVQQKALGTMGLSYCREACP